MIFKKSLLIYCDYYIGSETKTRTQSSQQYNKIPIFSFALGLKIHVFGFFQQDPENNKACVPGGEDGNYIMFARANSGGKSNMM